MVEQSLTALCSSWLFPQCVCYFQLMVVSTGLTMRTTRKPLNNSKRTSPQFRSWLVSHSSVTLLTALLTYTGRRALVELVANIILNAPQRDSCRRNTSSYVSFEKSPAFRIVSRTWHCLAIIFLVFSWCLHFAFCTTKGWDKCTYKQIKYLSCGSKIWQHTLHSRCPWS